MNLWNRIFHIDGRAEISPCHFEGNGYLFAIPTAKEKCCQLFMMHSGLKVHSRI
jgi:hypothetical protein